MQTFHVKKLVRALGCSLFLALAACSDRNDEQENLLQVQAYLNLAEVYMKQGQFRAAVIETQNAFALMPDNTDVLTFIGRLYLEIGDLAEATRQIDAALQLRPDDPELKLLKVEALLGSNRLQEGLELVNATSVPPELNVQKTWLLGNLQAASGNNEAAEQTFLQALEFDDAHVPSLIALSRLAYLGGDTAQATAYADQASRTGSDSPDLWIWKGQLAMLQEDYAAAEQAYKAAIDLMGEYDVMTAKKYATLESILVPLRALQKNDEALVYSGIIAQTPQGQFNTAFNNALSLLRQGPTSEAEAALENLLETAPNHPASNILVGLARYAEGEFGEAERLLSEYVQADTASPQLLATLAQTHLRMNRPAKALAVLQQAAESAPQNTALLAMIGSIQRSMGDLDGALATMNSALAIEPNSTDLLMGLASVQASRGEGDQAIDTLEKVIELAPEQMGARTALLNILATQEDPGAAQQRIDAWLRDDPSSAPYNLFAGILALRNDNAQQARSYFEKTISAEPDNLQAKLYLARSFVDDENYAEASNRFNALAAEYPGSPDAVGAILALGELTNSPEAGIQTVQKLAADNPDQFVPPLVLSQYYLQRNDLPNAVEQGEKAFAVAENTYTENLLIDVLMRSAVQQIEANNSTAATSFLDRILAIQNRNTRAHYLLAGIAATNKNFTRATEEMTLVRSLEPDAAISYELEGDILRAQERVPEALAAYQAGWEREKAPTLGVKILQTMKQQNQNDAAMAFLQSWTADVPAASAPLMFLGIEYQGLNQTDRAIDYYEQSYRLDPNNVIVLNNLAWLLQDSSPARALELSSRAAELFPQNADVLDTYGWILYKQGRTAQALSHLENAARLAPDSTGIQEHLSIVRSERQ